MIAFYWVAVVGLLILFAIAMWDCFGPMPRERGIWE